MDSLKVLVLEGEPGLSRSWFRMLVELFQALLHMSRLISEHEAQQQLVRLTGQQDFAMCCLASRLSPGRCDVSPCTRAVIG